jgi:integrase
MGEVKLGEVAAEAKSGGLTVAKVKTAKPGKYHDGGGVGLFLLVDKTGGRFWVQRIVVNGKRREIGLGGFPVVGLADARKAALANKQLTFAGGDPLAERRKTREALSFADAVDRYLAAKLEEFRSEKHRKQWRAAMDAYARPVLGEMPVRSVEMADVLRVLQPIWATKTETASKLRGRIESVLSWATVAGHRTGDNPARWKGNLAEMLGRPDKLAKTTNHPALGQADVPSWWAALAEREGMAARALEFLTLTAARSGEVRGMTWGEVDLTNAVWTVPAERMKMGKEHRVPLTKEAVAILEALPRLAGSEFVFFAQRGGQLSDMSISAVMRRMQEAETAAQRPGYLDPRSKRPAVPHGLRSTFRDWAAETGVERDMAEMALAHRVGDEVERAYRRSDMLERRRAMMASWGVFLRGETADPVVVPLRGVR